MFRLRGAKVSVTKYRFLQQLLAPKLRGHTLGRLHRSLEKPSEPLSASTVWGTSVYQEETAEPEHASANAGAEMPI